MSQKLMSFTVADRDDELLATIRNDLIDETREAPSHLIEKSFVSTEGLIGSMPKADRTVRKDVLMKLSSTLEWKPTQVALTTAGLFMARPDEEHLRDLVPLYEIRDIKKKAEAQSEYGNPRDESVGNTAEVASHSGFGSIRNVKMSSLVDTTTESQGAEQLFCFQVRTIADGYNR